MFDYPKIYGKEKLLYDSIFVNHQSKAEMYHYIELGTHENEYFKISDFEKGNYYILNNREISITDASKIHVKDGMDELFSELEETD